MFGPLGLFNYLTAKRSIIYLILTGIKLPVSIYKGKQNLKYCNNQGNGEQNEAEKLRTKQKVENK